MNRRAFERHTPNPTYSVKRRPHPINAASMSKKLLPGRRPHVIQSNADMTVISSSRRSVLADAVTHL